MRIRLLNPDRSQADSSEIDRWVDRAENKEIDLSKFISLLLMISVDPRPECKAAFKAVMYNLSMLLQCEGVLNLTSTRYPDIETANSELASMLAPDKE